ncbi:hypothetical protein AB0F72_08545 [Actinoplanes sp. NPDC023936]|uniref:hypothetical protein n=1 Tax=Actinoplanes sp. NPDC023936 TaxID=3154910 RepID=UPI0034062D28
MGKTWTGSGRIDGTADVRAALDRINGAQRGNLALAPVTTADQADLTSPNATRVLPCDPQLAPLLPWPGGLRRGATVAAVGSTSLLMLLLAGAMRESGAWAAVVGAPMFGGLAASEIGVDLGRLALVPEPGPDWPQIVSALIDGVDLVAVQPPAGTSEGVVRSLVARARQKGCVLIPTRPVPGTDLTLEVTGRRWHGLGDGRGRLRYCELDVRATGRGRAVRPKTATVTVGSKPAPLDIPPPKHLRVEPETADTGMWANVVPMRPPADPWAGLRVHR